MGLKPLENLKGFAQGKPPLMIFILCLGLFAIVLMTLRYYVQVTEVPNPDVSSDWNRFLETFSEMEFCILSNSSDAVRVMSSPSEPLETSPKQTLPPIGKDAVETEATTPSISDSPRNYSISMLLSVHPTRDFLRIKHNLTHLTGSFEARDLGLKGSVANEMINVTMDLPYEWNSTHCETGVRCPPVQIYACVQLHGAASVFPETKHPDVCESVNDTAYAQEFNARIKPQAAHNMFPSYYCQKQPRIKLKYTLDPSLTVYLSIHDKSVINLHLLHTSYFLFVMVVMLLAYAIIKGHTTHPTHVIQPRQGDKVYVAVQS